MRNFLIFLFITLLCSVILYFTGHSLLQSSFENRLKSIPSELEKFGINMEPISLENIRVNSGKSLTINNIKTRLNFSNRKYYSSNETFGFSASDAVLEAEDYNFKKLKLIINNLTIQNIGADDNIENAYAESKDYNDTIKFQYLSTEFDNKDSNPEQATRALLQKFANYLHSSKLEVPLNFSGNIVLNTGKTLKLSFENDFYINKSEFDKFSSYALTESEIEFLSKHPLRVGSVFEIKEESLSLLKKLEGGTNQEAVRTIYFILNLKYKFGADADLIIESYKSDPIKNSYLEIANEYATKNITKSELIKLIEEQGKNFPIRSKANYSLN